MLRKQVDMLGKKIKQARKQDKAINTLGKNIESNKET